MLEVSRDERMEEREIRKDVEPQGKDRIINAQLASHIIEK